MNELPKISVLTCCYNAGTFLKEAVESVLRQAYEKFEYVLVDDGSTDNTLSILKGYAAKDKRIVIVEKEHSGLTASLNIGLEQAKGEWVARLDADDIAVPDRLSNQWDFVQNNDRIVLLGGGCIEVDENGIAIKKHIYPTEQNALMSRLETGKAFFSHSSAFFNKAYVLELGGYNPKFVRSQDWDLWLRIGENAQIGCLPLPVVKLRKHSQAISNTNQGKLQLVMGVCAGICHFRRKWGLSDPSQVEQDIWQKFLKWVEKRIEEEEFFHIRQEWQALRNTWYVNLNRSKLKRIVTLMGQLKNNPLARKVFWRRFRKNKLALNLAQESRRIW